MDNCTNTTLIIGFSKSTLVIELIIYVLGTIGSVLCLYCLLNCKKVQEGMKIHLCLLFSLSLVACGLALPGNAVVEHGKFLGWVRNENAIRGFVAFCTILAVLDRNINAVLAVYRMVAVAFPFRYKVISRKAVSLVVEVTVCVSVISLWVIYFAQKNYAFVCAVYPTISPLVYILYCTFTVAPFIITVFAYIAMVSSMASRKQSIAEFMAQTRGEKDQPTMSVTILILVNIIVDVPHIILHGMEIGSAEIASVVIHIIYRLHFALDPFIFIGLNRRYRQMILRKVSSLVQVGSVSDSPHARGEGTSGATQLQTQGYLHTGTP